MKAIFAFLVVSYALQAQAVSAPSAMASGTNEGSRIATVQDLFLNDLTPQVASESLVMGQIQASQSYVLPVYSIDSQIRTTSTGKGYDPWSCVSYAKYRRPDQDFAWITPNKVKAYQIEPSVGLLVLTTEGPVGHVAYVESVSDSTLIITEANYEAGKVTRRELPRSSPLIRGYR